MEILEYLPQYREVCAAIWLTSQTASCPDVNEDVFLAMYPQVYHDLLPSLTSFVAYQDGAPESFLSVNALGEIILFNTAVCFQKKGHGRALLSEAKKRFPAGLKVVAHRCQTTACELLEKEGFRRADTPVEADAAGDRVGFFWQD